MVSRSLVARGVKHGCLSPFVWHRILAIGLLTCLAHGIAEAQLTVAQHVRVAFSKYIYFLSIKIMDISPHNQY